jgi:hypothetical protein
MDDYRISQLQELDEIPRRLLRLLNEASLLPGAGASTGGTSGACFYTSLGQQTCTETSATACACMHGRFVENESCRIPDPRDNFDSVDESQIAAQEQLIQGLILCANDANTNALVSAPLGVCTYQSMGQERSVETTEAVCVTGLNGVWSPREQPTQGKAGSPDTGSKSPA